MVIAVAEAKRRGLSGREEGYLRGGGAVGARGAVDGTRRGIVGAAKKKLLRLPGRQGAADCRQWAAGGRQGVVKGPPAIVKVYQVPGTSLADITRVLAILRRGP